MSVDSALLNPILNGPFDPPERHFFVGADGPTDEIRPGRRPSESFIPIPQERKHRGRTVTDVDDVTIDSAEDGFANVSGERKLGRLKVLIVRMNAELLMGDALKKTGAGNLFTVFFRARCTDPPGAGRHGPDRSRALRC